jgi:hypothetical protein
MNGGEDNCDALQAERDAVRARIESWQVLKDSFEQLAAHFGTGPQAEEYERRAASAGTIIADLQREERTVQRQLDACLEARLMRPPTITIAGIERTQAIQFFRPALVPCPDRPGQASCPENDIRLIAGKTTVLRVYADVTIGTPSIVELSGVLETRQAGSASWDVPPITPYNAPVAARRASAILRSEAGHTLNFRIPAERCRGTLETRLTLFDPGHPGEAAYTGPSVATTLQFSSARPLQIRLIRIRYANAARGLDIPAPSVADFWTTAEYVLRTYPISRIDIVAESEELYDGDFTSFFDTSPGAIGTTDSIFTIIDRVVAAEQQPSAVYYALFDGRPNQSGAGGWASGMRATGPAFAGSTMAQEIGHTCGRGHAPCGVGDPDAGYPTYDRYRPGSIGEYGFDVIDGVVFDPATTFDFMSYCGPTWVSPYTYEALMNCFPTPEAAGGGAPAERLRGRRELLRLFLTIYRDGRVKLRRPGFHAPGELRQEGGQATPFLVELQDAEGLPLATKRLRLDDVHRSLDDASLDFLVEIPWRPDTAKVVVQRERETLHSIDVAKQAPRITLTWRSRDKPVTGTQKITWKASGASGLTYMLRYSSDAGETFRMLADQLTESAQEVDFDSLPGGEKCLVQVLATTGARTGIATSDTFRVPPKRRRPVILSPPDGQTFVRGQTVQFFGIASASGVERWSPEELSWSTSINGYLGAGSKLLVHTLSPGRHCIILRVDDGCGGEASSSIYITVKARSIE